MNKLDELNKHLEGSSNIILTIGGVVALVWGFHAYVGYLVEEKIQEKSTLEKLAAEVYPVIVFNEKGSIIYGNAAMSLLVDKIKVDTINKYYQVTIVPKKLLESPPLLSCLNAQCSSISERGEGLSWIYKIVAGVTVTETDLGAVMPGPILFKLEIIK